MRINWNALAAIAPLFFVIIGWAISIEVRMSQSSNIQNIENELNAIKQDERQSAQTLSNQIDTFANEVRGLIRRTQNIEELMQPLLIDYKVKKEIEKLVPSSAVGVGGPSESPAPYSSHPKPIFDTAKKWASESIQRGQQKN